MIRLKFLKTRIFHFSASIKLSIIPDNKFWVARDLPKIVLIQSKSDDKGQKLL